MDILRNLPDDLQWYTWKLYNSTHVHDELIRTYKSVWKDPSDSIMCICRDVGCVQHGHHELAELIEDHNMWALNECIQFKCENCKHYGFPCDNLSVYGFDNMSLMGQWDAQFT